MVVVGSLNADWVACVQAAPNPGQTVMGHRFEVFCGGKGANQAFAAARLGAHVTFVGRVGQDPYGDRQIDNLAAAGVDTRWITRDPTRPTGTAIIVVDATAQNRIIVIPGANGAFVPTQLEPAATLLRQAAVVLLQLEIPLETVQMAVRITREGGGCVFLDPAPAQPLPDEILAGLDYLTPNLSELSELTGAGLREDASHDEIVTRARLLCGRGVRHVVVKCGERGALLVDPECFMVVPAHPVPACDTTAAGDCFNAAFATALMEGAPETEAARFAAVAAAISVSRPGAQSAMPARAEVDRVLVVPGTVPIATPIPP